MYDPNEFRQPHLPLLREDMGGREKYALAQIAQVNETGQKSTRLVVEVPRYGGLDGVRIAHPALSRSSGSVKLPIRQKKTPGGDLQETAHAVVLPIEGRPEDSAVLGYVDFEGDNDLLQRITEAVRLNPDLEFSWLDRHPAGQEQKHDGHGSWSMETASGHVIKLVERKGEESIEILTADGKSLTLRARGDGTVLVQSDSGNVEMLTGELARILGLNTEVMAEENVDVVAGKKVSVIGKTVDMLASGNANVAATGDVNVGAGGAARFLSSEVALGIEANLKKIITEELIALFNAHIHGGVNTGAGSSGPPSTPITSAQVATTNTKAS